MDIAHPVTSSVASISFSFLTTEDVRRISVKQIINPVLLDNLNRPNAGGLYDSALGPLSNRDICATCRLNYFSCPGHFGHIELPAPVYHPLFMMTAYKLLRATCLFCHHFKAPSILVLRTVSKLILLERGLLEAAEAIDDIAANPMKEDDPERPLEDLSIQINLFVATHLRLSSKKKRGDYKDGALYQARKAAIDDFLKATLLSSKKCQRKECGAHAYSFRKEGYTKIIEYDLKPNQKLHHAAAGLRRPNIWALDAIKGNGKENIQANDSDSDSEAMEVEDPINDNIDEESITTKEDDEVVEKEDMARAANGKIKGARGRNERIVAPEEVRAHLRRLFHNETKICSLIFGRQGPYASGIQGSKSTASADMFFLDTLAVSPTRFRPASMMADKTFEHPHNEHLTKVLNTSYRLRDLNEALKIASSKEMNREENPDDPRKLYASLLETLIVLQTEVNTFIDSSKNTAPLRQGKLPTPGIKQGLEKKEGLFRMHMMGKRVNYAARSVISPDVNIETNEIGVPPIFARKLTFPETVTQHNVTELRELVIRGPREHPGATMVQFEDGSSQSLDKLSVEQRTAIANQLLTPREIEKGSAVHGLRTKTPFIGKKVFRHLRDGDILILNRQPTLHKPSMMAHKAKVLQGEKTIRMHYANCNSYNADFDGDEMNIHFAQSQIARAEAMFIANTDNQYLVPTSGKPLRGLIQDHVVAGLWITNKATFFTREEYQQIIYGALRPEDNYTGGGRVLLVPPAILKPEPLWTGKQIISTVLKNITPRSAAPLTMKSKAQIPNPSWGRRDDTTFPGLTKKEVEKMQKNLSEEKVLVLQGDLVRGILDKSQFGAASYGLVHSVYDIYGADIAGRLLSILSRLFTKYLQHRAFTCRMDDLALTPKGEEARRVAMNGGTSYGTSAAISFFSDLDSASPNKSGLENELNDLLEKVLRDDAQMAGLDNIVKSKMKTLSEAVVKASIPGGLLRSFPKNNMQTMTNSGAKGSSTNARQISALLGQQELEGRRVPVMVSGKTLPSFKPFETAAIAGGYVGSRFLTGLRAQEFYFHCMAGREGLIDTAVKTSRSGYLQRCLIKHLEGIRVHYDHTVRGADSAIYQFQYGEDGLDVTKQMHLLQFAFNLKNHKSLASKFMIKQLGTTHVNEQEASEHMKKILRKKRKHPDAILPTPTLDKFIPSIYLGATSEKFAEKVEEYIETNKNHLLITKHQTNQRKTIEPVLHAKLFKSLMSVRYMRSLVEPGEAVGLLASQSVGEPSTQMTLNTFHFAGHGAANVTLGIPRLREIVMTAASKPKTPMMNMPIRKGIPIEDVKQFCQQGSRLTLSHLVESITVTEKVRVQHDHRNKVFSVQMKIFPRDEYMAHHFITSSQILAAIGSKFAPKLKREINNEFKRLDSDLKIQATGIGKGKAVRSAPGGGEGDDEPESAPRNEEEGSEIGDGDATTEKRAKQKEQQTTYEDDEEENADEEDAAIEAGTDSDSSMDEDESVSQPEEDDIGAAVQVAEELFANSLPLLPGSFSFDDQDGLSFDLEYDLHRPKLLLIGILERVCRNSVVRDVHGIAKCHPPHEGTTEYTRAVEDGIVVGDADIVVEGSNLREMAFLAEDVVDINRIKTNDIHAILTNYGVEAARATIVQEIANVFGLYSINVNVRHLMLIADYMTFDGGFKPFNRRGIATHTSPLLKASYETTASFLSDATLHGDYDDLTTPSGNIVVGRPALSGTGVFDIVMPLE